ncbi:MAG: hypothetical protein LBC08_02390, partial [Campylobacteraceae bacterium]|nr:hypothetical protein [Campylobacteraceae bacterium]
MPRFFKKILSFIAKGFLLALKGISFVISLFIGKIEWQTPIWLRYLGKALRFLARVLFKYKKTTAISLAAVILFSFAGYAAYVWQQNQPKPIEVAKIEKVKVHASVYKPYKTDYSRNTVVFNPLYVTFNDSAAPIENVSKVVEKGIKITPAIKGEWTWNNQYTLVFKPSEDWSVGEKYTVQINPKELLSEYVELEKEEYEFSTDPFTMSIAYRELYQNPEKPNEKNVIFEVNFGYPVDAASFEKQLSMQLQAPEKHKIAPKPYKFVVKYDDKKMKAWVRSEFIKLPEIDSEMVLNIKKGVKSSIGGAPINSDLAVSQQVSSVYTNVVSNVFLTIAENEGNEQEQILVVKLIDKVNINDLSKQVKAVVLPKDKPSVRGSNFVRDYRWTNNDDIGPEVLALSKPLELKLDALEDDFQNIASFKYKSGTNDYIYVTIGKDLETIGGYKPKTSLWTVLDVPQFPEVLKFANDGVLLSLKGEKKVPIFARNIPGFQLEINRVLSSQIQHLVNFNENDWQFSQTSFGYTDKSYFTEKFTYNKTMPVTTSGKISYEGVDLGNYINENRKNTKGVFLVTLSTWDPKNNNTIDYAAGGSRLIVVTDLGIIAKRSADKSHDIFVQSIKDGRAVEGAKVSVLGRNGIAIASETTDSNGRAHFKPFQTDYKTPASQLPTVYIVQYDDDLSFLPFDEYAYSRKLEFSRFDTGGVQNVVEQGKLSAYIFSDRGLYRPGDNVNIGSIVRAEDWNIPIGGIPVTASVYDARGQLFQSKDFTIDESGFNELSFTTTLDSPTGNWVVYLHVATSYQDKKKAGILLGSTSVSIKEFEPDRMKAELKLTPSKVKGWVKPSELSAVLKVENLFGTPAQNRRVTSSLILSPAAFSFREYQGYYFYDGYYSSERFDIDLEESQTDENGIAKLNLLLEEYEKATYQMAIVAEAFEAGAGRSVASTASALISPNDYLIGAKADGDLGYIKKNIDRKLNFIAVNQNLTKIAADNLSVEILEQKYISVLTLQNS